MTKTPHTPIVKLAHPSMMTMIIEMNESNTFRVTTTDHIDGETNVEDNINPETYVTHALQGGWKLCPMNRPVNWTGLDF